MLARGGSRGVMLTASLSATPVLASFFLFKEKKKKHHWTINTQIFVEGMFSASQIRTTQCHFLIPMTISDLRTWFRGSSSAISGPHPFILNGWVDLTIDTTTYCAQNTGVLGCLKVQRYCIWIFILKKVKYSIFNKVKIVLKLMAIFTASLL